MTKKEKFLSVMRGEKPLKWMGHAFEAQRQDLMFYCTMDPISVWDILWIEGDDVVDNWGVNHRYHPGEDPGIIPMVTEENQVIKDITKWRDYVTFPEIPDLDWSAAKAEVAATDRDEYLVMVPSFRGLFERAHCLMTFEDCLMNMYTEPEAMYDLFGAYADWKMKAFELIIDNMDPDILHSHDDWGSHVQLFFSPEKFEELLFPHYKRMYDYVKSRGVLVQHHCDCYIMGLEKYFPQLGIDMWQGAFSTNDIQQIKKNTDNKLLIMGGIDQVKIDRLPNEITEDDIRAEVRRAIDVNAPGGMFLPCIPSGGVPLNGWITPIVVDECNKYGAEWLAKNS
ncbi:MAG: methyltransferase [Clostridiales bacterium]|nr:methyltransferase [Clostridiales bacterium]